MAEIALSEGENHLRFALKVGELGSWQVDLSDFSMTSCDGCRANFGIAPGEDFPYSRLVEMIHPDDRERQRTAVEQTIVTGKDYNCEYRINTPAGELRWIDARGRVVFDEGGKPLFISGTTQNITTRKRGEMNLAFLAEISQDLARLTSIDEIIQKVGAKIGAYLNLSLCTFVEINEAADEAVITHDWHRADVPGRVGVYRLSDYVTNEFQKAGRAEEIFVVRDTHADSRTDAAQYAALQIGSFLSVPFVRNGEWRFLIAVYHAKPHDWRTDEIELMRELTTRIWTRLERARAEEAVRESEEKFRNLANSISQFAWMADASGYIFWYNERWYEYTGTTLEEMQGWGWRKVLHPEHAERVVEKIQRSWDTGEVWEDTFPLKGKDGQYRWFLSRALPIRHEAGRIVRWFGTNTDVTEQLAAEEALRATMEREQALRVKAEEANRLKDEFLATVSHELRTPLTSILGWSAMLRRTDFDAATRARALATIERNAHAQQQIIEDLLEVSRIITGKLRMDTETVELTQVIEAALDVVRPAAAAKNIHLRAMLNPAVAPIAGDASRLQQIVWNLLTNAVKFTPPAGLVEVRLESAHSHAEITVCDNGDGIDADFLPYVFDRFRQADGTTKRAHGGLGLGLAIVRHLVEAHGGTVQVASKGKGQGSTFTIKLPLMPVASSGDSATQSESPLSGRMENLPSVSPRALEGVRVLLVDDDDDGRQLLSMLLAGCGAEVVEAESAAGALALFRQSKPDVIISDIGMPEEDGYDLIRQVRELERGSSEQTPAVALTAYAREDDRARALATGYQTQRPKPIELASVVATIAKLVGKATAI
ncbi:MAG: PAS domain-containing protein [Pyrinomonadaceae bacterium]